MAKAFELLFVVIKAVNKKKRVYGYGPKVV